MPGHSRFSSFAVATTLLACGAPQPDTVPPRSVAASSTVPPATRVRPFLSLSDADGRDSISAQSLLDPPPAAPTPDPILLASACELQLPREDLKRASYVIEPGMSRDEKEARRRLHHDAIAFRTRHYGHVDGFGDPQANRLEPKHYAKDGMFFGIPVRMNVRVLDALGCVEKAIVARCEATPYRPHVLDGLRTANTFHNDEVSNHLYGIAVDVDFDSNPCCGCVARISDRPLCKRPVSSPFERTRLPRCWVDTFEAFGFSWLGYDRLEDTMHFEFLGDPDRIVKSGGARK